MSDRSVKYTMLDDAIRVERRKAVRRARWDYYKYSWRVLQARTHYYLLRCAHSMRAAAKGGADNG